MDGTPRGGIYGVEMLVAVDDQSNLGHRYPERVPPLLEQGARELERAVDPAGRRFDNPVLGLYRFRDAKLQRAQMFHFDTAAIVGFLQGAK